METESKRQLGREEKAVRASPSEAVGDVLDTRVIFRRLFLEELRSGGLNRSRRKRLVQYAARFGLNGVQVGELITACQRDMQREQDAVETTPQLRLVVDDGEQKNAGRWTRYVRGAGLLVAGAILLIWWAIRGN